VSEGWGGGDSLALEARALSKRFGSTVAVSDFSLSVPSGAIYGLIGPNGAGKTTSLRMLATLLEPDGGDAWIGGVSVRRDQAGVRRNLGYMPDYFGVYPELKVGEYLDFYAACHGVSSGRRGAVTTDLLQLVDLTHKRDSYVEGLSRGMQQRLGLARALVHDPAVLLLDEPASGLDPRARLELREVVRELGRMGKAVVISSHILAELADLCTHIAIVDGGRVLTAGTVEAVTRRLHGGRSVRVQVLGEGERLRDVLLAWPGVHAVQLEESLLPQPAEQAHTPQPLRGANIGRADIPPPRAGKGEPPDGAGEPINRVEQPSEGAGAQTGGGVATVRFVLDGDEQALRRLLADLMGAGLPIFGFGQDTSDLEDVFLRVTRRLGDAAAEPGGAGDVHGGAEGSGDADGG
jgi:ABC-2 type transport system ATP-binding protein